ncbi:MAG: hypothetical protein R2729_02075 [Bryobacteraceae bacterium]
MNYATKLLPVLAVAGLMVAAGSAARDNQHQAEHRTSQFQGAKANTGMAIHFVQDGKSVLKVTEDFRTPDTPAPTWRAVDSKGNVYTLDAFKIKGGEKRQIAVPSYVKDIAKVQVYCAWAEVLLGEASFASPVK